MKSESVEMGFRRCQEVLALLDQSLHNRRMINRTTAGEGQGKILYDHCSFRVQSEKDLRRRRANMGEPRVKLREGSSVQGHMFALHTSKVGRSKLSIVLMLSKELRVFAANSGWFQPGGHKGSA